MPTSPICDLLNLIEMLRDPQMNRDAVKKLHGRNAFTDGSLRGKDLSRVNLSGEALTYADFERTNLSYAGLSTIMMAANLQNVNLTEAYLVDSDLGKSNFNGAILVGANLSRAVLGRVSFEGTDMRRCVLRDVRYLSDERLAKAYTLRHAIMKDGSLYDGRFRLKGDIEAAKQLGIDVDDDLAMAEFYRLDT